MVPKRVPAVSTLPVAEFSTPPLLERGRARQAASAVRQETKCPEAPEACGQAPSRPREKQQEAFRTFRAFRAEHRDVIRTFHKLENQYFRSQNKTDDAVYELGISEFKDVVVPLVQEIDATTIQYGDAEHAFFFHKKKNIDRIYISK